MSVTRTSVARVVYSGTLGTGSAPAEIWATGFWLAAYASTNNGGINMSTFVPDDYITNHALQFGNALMSVCSNEVTMTTIKCNVFSIGQRTVKGVSRWGIYQTTDPTAEQTHNVTGAGPVGVPFVTAFGWGLSCQTGGSRGIATKGRMFLPPVGVGVQTFDQNGNWDPSAVTAVSAALSPAWDLLKASASGSDLNTFTPSIVSVPKPAGLAAGNLLTCNIADVTTAEHTVWTMHSRKNKLKSGGTRTVHASFA